MTSGSRARSRRQLNAVIPSEKRKEMKERITVIAQKRTKDVHALSVEEHKEIADIKEKYKEQKMQVVREFEKNRTAVIEQFEKEFGKDAVGYQLLGMGV